MNTIHYFVTGAGQGCMYEAREVVGKLPLLILLKKQAPKLAQLLSQDV